MKIKLNKYCLALNVVGATGMTIIYFNTSMPTSIIGMTAVAMIVFVGCIFMRND